MGQSIADQTERLRIDARKTDDLLSRADPAALGGSAVLVAQTVKVATYPTKAAAFYGCTTANVLGPEVDGQAGTLSPGSGMFYAFNLGSAVPPVGTAIIVTFTGNRWTFRYDG